MLLIWTLLLIGFQLKIAPLSYSPQTNFFLRSTNKARPAASIPINKMRILSLLYPICNMKFQLPLVIDLSYLLSLMTVGVITSDILHKSP